MKKLLLLLLCVPLVGFGQLTMIPDVNFEQALINLGYDTGTPNGSVPTANINTLTTIDLSSTSISDLTGIEDFSALLYLYCQDNQLSSIDISN
ncbi:MAG: T9SS C-terminal target domain-containing protein, partial [Flavobacteriales bacterium]|nr:T9SS C-terminal target domain-containing protein [Flavobacteriales bacterium]